MTRRPKVVFITTDYSVAGGIERSLSILTQTLLDDLNMDVTLLTCGMTKKKPFFSFPNNLKVIKVKEGISLLKLDSKLKQLIHIVVPQLRYKVISDLLEELSFDYLIVDHPILLSALPPKKNRTWKLIFHAHEALRDFNLKYFFYYRG